MDRIIILASAYKPNTAPTNRLLSFLKGLDELGVGIELVFIYPNDKHSKLDTDAYKNVKVTYLWEGRRSHSKLMKYLRSFVDAARYAKKIQAKSQVLLIGASEYLPFFAKRKDLAVYQERTEHYDVVKLRPGFLQHRYMRSIPQLKGMFVISTALQEAYKAAGAKDVQILNMTVDANRFSNLKKATNETYIAYCGTASNNKDGVDDLIKAFAIVVKTHPDVKLKIMGKAPSKDDESGNLKLVESLGINDSVDFTGIIPAAEMPQMLKNATVVALARPDSLQAQCGFPTKLGEYLLSENPVVVTKVGDIPLFLKDGETALLSQDRDPEEFASKLLWALDNPKEAAEIGHRGAQVAMKAFNYRTEAEKIVRTIFKD